VRTRSVLAGLAVGAVAVAGVGVAIAAFDADDTRGEVVRVIDGDTLLALVDGDEITIRLLNIDTPETKDPSEPVQCLGPEATEFLTQRLPVGSEIELEYDQERTDRYDRTLAAVYESDSLINAEIAAEGLGVPVLFEPNRAFLPPVEEAYADAQEHGRGLFSEDVECTLPGQLQELSGAVEDIPQSVEGDPAPALSAAGAVVDDIDVFVGALAPEGLRGLGNGVLTSTLVASYLEGFRDDADSVRDRADGRRLALDQANTEYLEEQERLEEERREREEEQREREEEERREREEQEQEREEPAERDRKAEEDREADHSESSPTTSSGNSSSGGSSSGSPSGPESSEPSEHSGSSGSSGDESSDGSSGDPGGSPSGSGDSSGGSSGSGCAPYGPEIPHSDDGGYTGKRHGMPGGKTFRKCN